MTDSYGRTIDYLRISVTDRCDLRCVYCMPEEGVAPIGHDRVLRSEEIVRLSGIFARLGVKKLRLTGGEPLVRRGIEDLVASLKAVDGIEKVVMTTNGVMLGEKLPALVSAGLDGVNVSLDTLDPEHFRRITRCGGVEKVVASIEAAVAAGMPVKLNCVPTSMNAGDIPALACFARDLGIALRFIELMPIGMGGGMDGLSEARVTEILEAQLGPLSPERDPDPKDKCRYFEFAGGGRVGFISAISHKFCSFCDRLRLTSDGFLKTCLQYDVGVELRPLLSGTDAELEKAILATVEAKPMGHHFGDGDGGRDETRKMSQIGG